MEAMNDDYPSVCLVASCSDEGFTEYAYAADGKLVKRLKYNNGWYGDWEPARGLNPRTAAVRVLLKLIPKSHWA